MDGWSMTRRVRAGWARVDLLDHEAASEEVLAGRADGLSIHHGLRLAEAFC